MPRKRTRDVIPFPSRATSKTKPLIVLEDQLNWCRAIAKRVCKKHRLTGEDHLDDCTQSGVLEMCRKLPDFDRRINADQQDYDVVGAFRGYAYLFVKKACEREAERLINGGSYKSRRQVNGAPLIIGVPRSECKTPSGDQIEELSTRDFTATPYEFLRAA